MALQVGRFVDAVRSRWAQLELTPSLPRSALPCAYHGSKAASISATRASPGRIDRTEAGQPGRVCLGPDRGALEEPLDQEREATAGSPDRDDPNEIAGRVAAAGRWPISEDWAATVLGLVLVALVLAGVIGTGMVP